MTTYGYTRVSTDRQGLTGESLDVQLRMITGYAMQHGWTVAMTYVESGVSGSVPLASRPEGAKLFAGLERGDRVITCKLDRMFRSAVDALTVLQSLKERGVELHMLDLGGDVLSNGMSKLFFSIASAFAEAERDRTRERIKEVKADQKSRGRYLGGFVPFGYRVIAHEIPDRPGHVNKELVADPRQQELLDQARAMRKAGKSLDAICEELSIGLSKSGLHRLLREST